MYVPLDSFIFLKISLRFLHVTFLSELSERPSEKEFLLKIRNLFLPQEFPYIPSSAPSQKRNAEKEHAP
jgi:hypothetical protein